MDHDKQLVKNLWESHLNNVSGLTLLSNDTIVHMKRAFYTGMFGMMTSLKHIADQEIPDTEKHVMYESILAELKAFIDDVKKGLA